MYSANDACIALTEQLKIVPSDTRFCGINFYTFLKNKNMKTIDATLNRPEGERIIDANYVVADLEDKISQLKDEHSWDKNDRNGITLFKSAGLTVVLTCLHEEAVLNDVSIDGMLVLQVIEGKINVTTDGDAFELCDKKILMVQPNQVHSIYALKKSVLLLTTYLIHN